MTKQLEIGPGNERLDGDWVTMDCEPGPNVDVVCRWGEEDLPFGTGSFHLVYASHVLEHIPWHQTVAALKEVRRVLVDGGAFEVHVPDFDVLMRAAQGRCCPDDHAENGFNTELHWMHWVAERLFHMGPPGQWHRACFNEEHLTWCLRNAGFTKITRIDHERGNDHGVINLGLRAMNADLPEERPGVAVRPGDSRATAEYPGQVEGLPYCHSRREFDEDASEYFCAHPKVHAPASLVSPNICLNCSYSSSPPPTKFRPYPNNAGVVRKGPCWHLGKQIGVRACSTCKASVQLKVFECRHSDHDATTYSDCRKCGDYDRRLEQATVSNWAVGVTTAPRKQPTLERCLNSLDNAGWSDFRIFAEPGSPLPSGQAQVNVTQRDSHLGAWPNWILALTELYEREPYADAYLMVQDDAIFSRNLRRYLEALLWPQERLACVTLFVPRSTGGNSFVALPEHEHLPGAVALIFPNPAARALLSDNQIVLHRRKGPTSGRRRIDTAIRDWARRTELPIYRPPAAVTDHVGVTTTIWQDAEDTFTRNSPDFVGENFDAMTLLAERSPSSG